MICLLKMVDWQCHVMVNLVVSGTELHWVVLFPLDVPAAEATDLEVALAARHHADSEGSWISWTFDVFSAPRKLQKLREFWQSVLRPVQRPDWQRTSMSSISSSATQIWKRSFSNLSNQSFLSNPSWYFLLPFCHAFLPCFSIFF